MARKPAKQIVFSQKQTQANAARLLESTCEQLAGAGTYAKFPAYSKALILKNRYSPVKLYGSADKTLDEIFRNSLATTFIISLTGNQLSLSNYLREGLMLIQYVEMMARETSELHPDLIAAFEPYFSETEQYRSMVVEVIGILRRLAVIFSDWSETILSYDLDHLCAINGITASNQVNVTFLRPEQVSVQLEGNKREMLRTGWPEVMGSINWISIPPSRIGFYAGGNENRPVYIQRHALNRLDERLGIHKGLIHEAVAETLLAENIRWQRYNEKTLVPLEILNRKLGYIVISYDQEKIIIRSFLFLTNNGTPEGNKLSELTKLAPLDKKYLGMDTLIGFASYNFSSDPELSELFSQAGCGDLLQVDELIQFSEATVRSKNAQELMQYLTHYKMAQ